MPQQLPKQRQRKRKTPSVAAFMGLMNAVSPTKPSDYPEDDPEGAMQLAFEQMRTEFPRETAGASAKPMGAILQRILPAVEAVTFPWGAIRYNPYFTSRDQPSNQDLLAHELTHVKQFQDMPWWKLVTNPFSKYVTPYYQRPAEQEAFAASERRKQKRRDIPLPKPPKGGY